MASGWIGDLLMRVNDVLLALPSLLVLMLVASFVGRQTWVLVLTLALMYAPPIARVVRGASMSVLARDFVVAARMRGAGPVEIVVGEVLPNIRRVVLTEAGMQFSWILLAFSSLSFLGLGVPPPAPSWGSMIGEGRESLDIAPRLAFLPAIVMFLTVLSFNIVGDTMRALTDPRPGAL